MSGTICENCDQLVNSQDCATCMICGSGYCKECNNNTLSTTINGRFVTVSERYHKSWCHWCMVAGATEEQIKERFHITDNPLLLNSNK